MEVKIKQTSGIVEDVTVDLTDGEQQLQGMTCRVLNCDAVGNKEGQGSPAELCRTVSLC